VIYEYAVEPALVARWARDGVAGLAGQFGLDQRRVVSDLPTYWRGEVAAALLEEFGYDAGDSDYLEASAFLNAILDFMTANMVSRGICFQHERPWLEQALTVHGNEPFHAILAGAQVQDQPAVVTDRIADQLRDDRWYLPTVKPVPKTAPDLASMLAPLLRGATKIVVVDPYFDPRDSAYRCVLAALLESATALRGHGRTMPEVELIVGVGEGQPNGGALPVNTQLENAARNQCAWAAQHLAPSVPRDMRLTFRCIANFPDGDRLHNRFVLTDFAGVSLPYGTQALGPSVFDDLALLYQGQYEERWRQFTRPERLKLIGASQVIIGTR
jgi:hypothetical protein